MKKASARGALTNWRAQEDPVRTRKESQQARGAHQLEIAEGVMSQDTQQSQQEMGTHLLENAEGHHVTRKQQAS
jgi:hypothetical protein